MTPQEARKRQDAIRESFSRNREWSDNVGDLMRLNEELISGPERDEKLLAEAEKNKRRLAELDIKVVELTNTEHNLEREVIGRKAANEDLSRMVENLKQRLIESGGTSDAPETEEVMPKE